MPLNTFALAWLLVFVLLGAYFTLQAWYPRAPVR
jgi:hypothetical protein